MSGRVFLLTLLILSVFLYLTTFESQGLYAFVNDYDPVSGEPNCINCHPGDKSHLLIIPVMIRVSDVTAPDSVVSSFQLTLNMTRLP